ncbi:zinc finger domain-containing protein [Mycolicibacillus parakoreensis]
MTTNPTWRNQVLGVTCPSCKAPEGQVCATRLRRGYHLIRADKAVRREQRERYA